MAVAYAWLVLSESTVSPLNADLARHAEKALAGAMASLPAGSSPFAVLRIRLCTSGADMHSAVNCSDLRVLTEACERLQVSIREHESATLLPEGEILVLLCSLRSVIRAGAAADRLADLLQQPFFLNGQCLAVSASIGVALSPEDGVAADVLARRAGVALRYARTAGSGVVQFYDAAMDEECRPQSLHARRALLVQQWQAGHPTHLHLMNSAVALGSLGMR